MGKLYKADYCSLPEIERLKQISTLTSEVEQIHEQSAARPSELFDRLEKSFDRLMIDFPAEYDSYRLDEILVASIAPTVRAMSRVGVPVNY